MLLLAIIQLKWNQITKRQCNGHCDVNPSMNSGSAAKSSSQRIYHYPDSNHSRIQVVFFLSLSQGTLLYNVCNIDLPLKGFWYHPSWSRHYMCDRVLLARNQRFYHRKKLFGVGWFLFLYLHPSHQRIFFHMNRIPYIHLASTKVEELTCFCCKVCPLSYLLI